MFCVPIVAALEPQWSYTTDEQIQAVAVSSNASLIAAGGDGKHLFVFNNNGNLLWKQDLVSPVINIAVAVDGSSVTAMNDRGNVYSFNQSGGRIWDYKTNIGELSGKATSFTQTPDASFTVVGNEYGMIYKINKTGALVLENFLGRKICDLAISSDGNWTLAGEIGGYADLIDGGGNITWSTTGYANHVAMSHDANVFAIGGGDASLGASAIYWDQNCLNQQKMGTVNDIVTSPRGTTSIIASEDGTIYQYTREGKSQWNYSFNGKPITHVAIPSDASRIAALSRDNNIILLRNDGSLVATSEIKSPLLSLSFSPDGSSFVVGSRDRNVNFFKVPLDHTITPTPSPTPLPLVSAMQTDPIPSTTTIPESTGTTPAAGSLIVPVVLVAGLMLAHVIRKNH